MKIVISPAKSLDFETELPTAAYTSPVFLEQSKKLNSVLKKKKPKDLSDLMHISDKLAQLNWDRNQNFSLPFTPENARPAV
ncbi:MAG: peroxide stress protein YaaA, partial [Cellulophaga baltica]